MLQQTGIVRSLDHRNGRGHLTPAGRREVSIPFDSLGSEEISSLSVGEHVLFEIAGGPQQQVHAEHIRRAIAHLEAYQDYGGLYS